jgi:signal transduction histidine kinase
LKLRLAHPESDVLPLLQKIQTQTQRAAQVLIAVRSMLHPSPVDACALDVADLIARLEPHLQWLCSESGVHLHVESTHSAHVNLNSILFEQVLINLIKNSVQALNEIQRPQKNVTLSMASENKLLFIEVKDDGPGIPAGEELRVFDSFFTTKVDGLGIGLNLCKSVIERFNERLTLKSNGSSGACFLIELPLTSPS